MENYKVLGEVGDGTYGNVFKALHKPTQLIVAIKQFKDSEEEDPHVKKTAYREINALDSLRHNNIVNLFEVFKHKGRIYLIFEYGERTLLQDLDITPEGLPPDRIRKFMYQMLKGVQHMHDNNFIHRDIKPENLLISKNGFLKI